MFKKTICAGMISILMIGITGAANAVSIGLFTNNPSVTTPVENIVTGQGNTLTVLPNLSAGSLAGIEVLWVFNSNNGAQLPGLVNNAAAVSNFVNSGGVMLYHDREVDNAETVLPGGGGFNIIRDLSDDADIQVINNTTTVTNGPGGIINDATLDGGTSSSHGFSVSGSLPGTSLQILSRSNPLEIVDFIYAFGSGDVYYSTIPLDFYIGGPSAFATIYAPNVIAFAAERACPPGNVAPAFTAPIPSCGSTIPAIVGSPLSFSIAAEDADVGDDATLNVNALPAGATTLPALPAVGNPVSTTFEWTPGAGDVGNHLVTFTATDQCGEQVSCQLTINVTDNRPPDCSNATASSDELWPPNHRLVTVGILGVSDPDGDPVTITITGVTQDEPINGLGDGDTSPDANVAGDQVALRAERRGNGNGNGRVYTISFTASDGRGGSCDGTATVCVPHDRGHGAICVDDGLNFDATASLPNGLAKKKEPSVSAKPNPFNPNTTIAYSVQQRAAVRLEIFDALGRRIRELVNDVQGPGEHGAVWNGHDDSGQRVVSGIYLYRLTIGASEVRGRLVMIK